MFASFAVMGLKYCHSVALHPLTRAAFSTGTTAVMSAITIRQAQDTFGEAQTMFTDWRDTTKAAESAVRKNLNRPDKNAA